MKKTLLLLAIPVIAVSWSVSARGTGRTRLSNNRTAAHTGATSTQTKADAIVESVREQYAAGRISADSVVNLALYHKVWSPEVAERCLQLVAQGNTRAMTELGALYTHYTTAYRFPGKAPEGVKLLENAAHAGSSDAADYLGIYYQLNNDYRKAANYFNSTDKHNALGLTIIGGMYEDGAGYRKDPVKACEYYMQAAAMGNMSGASKYGFSLQRERFGKVNYPDAFFWLYIAGDLGDDAARTNLYLPRCGQQFGDALHTMLAQKSFELVENGRKGMSITGDPLYREGFLKGLRDREQAAEKGDDWSRYYLGSMNYNGDFLNQNYQQALYYYEPIIKNGTLPRQLLAVVYERVAEMYRDGKGVRADAAKADKYMRMAAGYGSLPAYKIVEKIPE